MLLHKNFIVTAAGWLLLSLPAYASTIKQTPADAWKKVFDDPISITLRPDLPKALAGSYITPTDRREPAIRGLAKLPDTTSTFLVPITAAPDVRVELVGYDRAITESVSGVTRDSPALTLTSVGLAILSICGAAEPAKRRRRRHEKEPAGDSAPAVGFTKEMVEV